MKKLSKTMSLLLFSSFIVSIFFIHDYFFASPHHEKKKKIQRDDEWKKVSEKNNSITIETTSQKDIKKYKLNYKNKKNSSTRKIASTKTHLMLKGRRLIGTNAHRFSSKNKQLNFKNKIDPLWENKLGNELVRFQKREDKVFVKKLDSLIRIENGVGRYVELVLISFQKQDGHNSFNAYVDSQSGIILSTWNRTIHENYKKRPIVFKLKHGEN